MYDPVLGSDMVYKGLRGQGIEIDKDCLYPSRGKGE